MQTNKLTEPDLRKIKEFLDGKTLDPTLRWADPIVLAIVTFALDAIDEYEGILTCEDCGSGVELSCQC